MSGNTLRIGIVVGEISGDHLGASLIQALKKRIPNVIVEGIVGEKLISSGAKVLFPMEKINLIGLFQPILHLPELFMIRRKLIQHFTENPPDVFIGIDAPDFNLGLERILRSRGIKTIHYVSPTIWGWRPGRIKTIKKAVDLMLTIFPFETKIYEKAEVPVQFVGHPLADEIPLENDIVKAKQVLGYSEKDTLVAILPGSRNKELELLTESYLRTAHWCLKQWNEKNDNENNLKFIVPVVSEKHKKLIEDILTRLSSEDGFNYSNLPLKIIVGKTRLAMEACDAALVTSGTATLEVMLYKKPMVVAYKLDTFTFHIVKHLAKSSRVAMSNIVAEETLVPEFLQYQIVPEEMGRALLKFLPKRKILENNVVLNKPDKNVENEVGLENQLDHQNVINNCTMNHIYHFVSRDEIINKYQHLHQKMRRNASESAADAVLALIGNC